MDNNRFLTYWIFGMGWYLHDKSTKRMIDNPARLCGCWDCEADAIKEANTIQAIEQLAITLDRPYHRNIDGTITII